MTHTPDPRALLCLLLLACSSSGPAAPDAAPDAGVLPEAAADDAQDALVDTGPPPPVDCDSLSLASVVTGLEMSVFVTAAKGDSTRLYVLEEPGRVRVVENGTLATKPFLDVSASVAQGDEQGLLGLAFHPDYGKNGRFWIFVVATSGDVVISEYARSAMDANVADPMPKREVLRFTPTPQNHIAGQIGFGPDGYLYAGIGDNTNAQTLSNKHGKMLRIDVDNPAAPPPGNMTGQGVDPLIWSYGFHNPWRWAFDRATSELYITDVGGEPPWEEINVQPPGKGGTNYGFDVMSGTDCVVPGCNKAGLELPVKEYDHTGGHCAIMGGYVYRGSKISCLVGKYVYMDMCSRHMWTMALQGGQIVHEQQLAPGALKKPLPTYPVSFGEDADGELYVVGLYGSVSKIVPAM